MNRNSVLRLAAVLVATLLFASPSAAAKSHLRPAETHGWTAVFWQLLGSFVPAVAQARGAMDPNGLSTPDHQATVFVEPVVETLDARGNMDPNGAQLH